MDPFYTWQQYETVWYRFPKDIINTNNIAKVAMFDLDWTLVKPYKGKFPKDYQDNLIMDNRINILKQYVNIEYLPIIITNQKLTSREILVDKIKRMNDIINKFNYYGIDPVIIMSTMDDKYRKPNIGMYDLLFKLLPNINSGFYCGDAAGRPNDFSDSDLKFAENAKIPFYLPEKLFGV